MADGTTRRGIMRTGGLGAMGIAGGAAGGVPGWPPPSPVNTDGVRDGRVVFPPWRGEADPPGAPPEGGQVRGPGPAPS